MKDYIKEQIKNIKDTNLARCIIREYLQVRILESLQNSGAFVNWAFVGGTSLRFLYSMPRFSEDLDFSLSKAGIEDNFTSFMKRAKSGYEAENYAISIKIKESKTVKSAFVKFTGLLYEMGLSPLSSETISIKVEINTNPPEGANLETSIIRRHILLNIRHYDKSSLLAGKLHALLSRKYVKGRDIYDLVWYLSDRTWPGPNLELLNNALKQTKWAGSRITEHNWRQELCERLSDFDWDKVIADIKPFVEKQSELNMITRNNVLELIKNR
ncbi:MAG: nucleotidyl transferase AbiEii/AbiGii toxin family protein [Sedimentisphaerales bacterium]|nr:nucleotidyl transferase AbiEii/AbiGii toxin family protein [Sedimentisphaerales bacterium]